MYYIRKLSNNGNLFKLMNTQETAVIDADILKQEFGTNNNTLSFWECQDCRNLCDMKDAIKAVLLSTTAIKASRFIVIEDAVIKKYGLTIDDSETGATGYIGYEHLHVNITNLTYQKIGDVIDMLREIASNEMYTPSLDKKDVKSYIKEVYRSGLLNKNAIHPDLRKDIDKFLFS